MKKTLVAVLVGVASFSALNVNAAASTVTDAGTVNFTGSVVDTPCVVEAQNQTLNVAMGQVKSAAFTGAASVAGTAQPIDIVLSECDTAGGTVKVKFTGAPAVDNTSLALTQSGDEAKNVGIKIMEADGTTALGMGKDSAAATYVQGTNTLHYTAQYVQTTGVAGDVTTGTANATTNFDLTYE